MASISNEPLVTTAVDGDLPFKMIGGLAASCFIGAFVCDIVYALDPDFLWVTFSVWLITIGLVVAGVAVLVGLVDRARRKRLGALSSRRVHFVGFAAVVVVEFFNAFVHSRDAYEAVVPDGILLSALAVALLVATPLVARAFSSSRSRKTTF